MSSAALRTRASRALASPLLTSSTRRFSAGAGAPNQSTSADIFSIIARAKQTGGSGGGGGGFEAGGGGGGDGGDNHGLGALRAGASLPRRTQHLPPAPAPEQVEGGAALRRAVRAVVDNIDAEGRLSVGGTLKLLHLQKTFLPGHVGTRRDALALLSLVRTLERKKVSLDCTFLYDVMRTACVAFPLLRAPPRAVGDFLASRLHHAAAAFKSNPIPFLERIVPLYVKACVGLQLESTHLHHVSSLLFKSPQAKPKTKAATTVTSTTTASAPSKKRGGSKAKAAQKRREAEAAAAAEAEAEAEAAAAALPCDTVQVPAVYDETFHYALERVTLSLFELAEKWHAKAFQRTRCVVITKLGKRPVWRERASKYHLAVLEKLEVVFEALENLTLSYQSGVLGVSTPVVENSGFYKLVLKEAKRSPAPPVVATELTAAAAAAPSSPPPKQGRAAAAAARRKRRSVVEGVVEGPSEGAHEQLRRQFGVARDAEDGEGEELREVYNPASEAEEAEAGAAAADAAAAAEGGNPAEAGPPQQQQQKKKQKKQRQGGVASGSKSGGNRRSPASFDAEVDDATFDDIQGATGALLIDEDGSVVESVVVHVEALVAGFHPTESIHVPSDQCRFALEGPQMDFQAPAKPAFKRHLFKRSPRIPKDIRDM